MHVKTGKHAIDASDAEWIIGSDEAGYGTLAGDLIVTAVAVHRDWFDPEVTDSKALSDAARKRVVRRYRNANEVTRFIHRTSPSKIDELGVWSALIISHNHVHRSSEELLRAVLKRECKVLHVVDGLENARSRLDDNLIPLTEADALVPAVSLASCFAKVVQCELMDRADRAYPGYGFAQHRGYWTAQHKRSASRLGVCPIHRRSYKPIRDLLSGENPDRRGRPSDVEGPG